MGERQKNNCAAKKAKNAPTHHEIAAIARMMTDTDRNLWQARAAIGSVGHGAFRACQCSQTAAAMRTPETPNTIGLFSESHVIWGTADTSPATTAPIPSATNNAGSAQQMSVAVEPKSANTGAAVSRHEKGSLLMVWPGGGYRSPHNRRA